jgi:hypothetical protein
MPCGDRGAIVWALIAVSKKTSKTQREVDAAFSDAVRGADRSA